MFPAVNANALSCLFNSFPLSLPLKTPTLFLSLFLFCSFVEKQLKVDLVMTKPFMFSLIGFSLYKTFLDPVYIYV
jgi:hypothetical protein